MFNNFSNSFGNTFGRVDTVGNMRYVKDNTGRLLGIYDSSSGTLKDSAGRLIARGSSEIIGMLFNKR